jgi:hypothetical protein
MLLVCITNRSTRNTLVPAQKPSTANINREEAFKSGSLTGFLNATTQTIPDAT